MKRIGLVLVLLFFLSAAGFVSRVAWAQDEKSAENAKKAAAQDPPAATANETPAKPETPAAQSETPQAKPAAAPTPVDPAAAKAAAEEFKSKLNEWKVILKELRTVRTRFDTAEPEQVKGIQDEWDALVRRGEALIPQLRVAGMKAYAAAPKDDRELERFLIKVVKDDMMADRYEEAIVLAKTLLDAGCEDKEIIDAAGAAAFAVNDFDAAEKYLKQAKKEGSLSTVGQNDLSLIPQYRDFWAEEQEIRKKEAEKNDLPRVKLTTSKGDIVLELFENEAPGTVGNFISLVEKGFYNGLTFHRVIPGFMAQGGCPEGTGSGGPGYSIYCECYQPNYRKHFRGTLSMAHSGRDTGGSQFFLTFVPTAHLNGRHTAFGRVIEGMDVLAKLNRINPDEKEKNEFPADTIVKAEVLRKRDHEYRPNKVQ